MKFVQDLKLVVGFTVVGVVLMTLTIVWRVNPVEGSVIPTFLTNNPVGRAVVGCLLVTCMPSWIAGVWLSSVLPLPESAQYAVSCGMMILLQALAWGLVGKGISLGLQKIKEKQEPK